MQISAAAKFLELNRPNSVEWKYYGGKNGVVRFLARSTGSDPGLKQSLGTAVDYLEHAFNDRFAEVFNGLVVELVDYFINTGGQTQGEQNKILLDKTKNSLSLTQAKDFLDSSEGLAQSEWNALVKDPSAPASTATVQLIHEMGHLVDYRLGGEDIYNRLDPAASPTEYGKKSPKEAFAEAFTFFVFGKELSHDATTVLIQDSINNLLDQKQ